MDEKSLRHYVKRECNKAGSMRQFAIMHGVNISWLSRFLAGKEGPGPTLLDAVGVEQVITYRKRRD